MTAPRTPVRVGLSLAQRVQRLTATALDEPLNRTTRRASADYTMQDTDDEIIVNSAAPVTVTLLSPGAVLGRSFTVIRAGTGAVSIAATALISGTSPRALATQWDTLTIKAIDSTGSGDYTYVIL